MPCSASRQQDHGQRFQRSPVAARAPQEEPDADRREAVDRGDHRVALDHPFERLRPLEGEALDELAFELARVRARSRSRSSRRGSSAGRGAPAPAPPRRPCGPGASPVPGLVAGAPHQREPASSSIIERMKWPITSSGRRSYLTTRAPRIAWATTPSGSRRAEHCQVPAVRPAEEGEEGGGDHRDADQAGDDPVAVLDDRVRFERRLVPPP